MTQFNVLRRRHLMVGCDWHIAHPPPIGTPLWPPGPYAVFNIMTNMLGIELTVLYSPTVRADAMQANMCKGSDIGMLTPHIGVPSITIAIEMLFAGSKCHFGPMNVMVPTQHGGKGNPAAAVGVVFNPNLNCGFPIPTPLGFVLATNTTQVTMTLGDIVAGFYGMVVDFVFQTAINLISHFAVGKFFNWIGPKVAVRAGVRPLSRAASRRAARESWRAAGKVGPLGRFVTPAIRNAPIQRFSDIFGMVANNPVAFMLGSPLGTAADAPGVGGGTIYGGARGALERLGLPTEQDVRGAVDGPAPSGKKAPSTSTPAPAPTPTPAPAPAPTPTPTPTPAPAPTPNSTPVPPPGDAPVCSPENPVESYFNDPSVEDIGGQ